MGKGSFTKVPFSKRICATTMSLVMVAAFAPNVAVAVADTGDGQGAGSVEQPSTSTVDLGSAWVSISGNSYFAYTGKAVKPRVTVGYWDQAQRKTVTVDPANYTLSYQKVSRDASGVEGTSGVQQGDVIEVGEYRVTAVAKDGSGYTGSSSTTFCIVKATDLTYADIMTNYSRYFTDGSAVAPNVTVRDISGVVINPANYTLSYEKYDRDQNGDVTWTPVDAGALTEEGRYRAVATGVESKGYTGKTPYGAWFTIANARNLSNDNVDIDKSRFVYDGSPAQPKVKVSYYDYKSHKYVTIPSDAYTLKFEKLNGQVDEDDNELWDEVSADNLTSAGEYRVTAVAKDGSGYTGSTDSEEFSIVDAKDLSNASVRAGYEYFYTGKAITPKLRVTDAADDVVSADKYTVSYEEATGKDDYNDPIYSKVDAAQVKEAGQYRVTVTAKDGSGYTGSESAEFKITDTANLDNGDLYISGDNGLYYSGKALAPKVSVRDAANNLVSPKNYDLSYEKISRDDEDNETYTKIAAGQVVDAGEYRVTATAKQGSGYTGSCHGDFRIREGRDFNDVRVSRTLYSGSVVRPKVAVYAYDNRDYGEDVRVDPAKYTLSYEKYDESAYDYTPIAADKLMDVGRYCVTATANPGSGYEGAETGYFSIIDGADLDNATLYITGKNKREYDYTGKPISPKVTLKDAAGKKVSSNAYELSYEKYDDSKKDFASVDKGEVLQPGQYRVTATAKDGSGYKGSQSRTFSIASNNNLADGGIDFTACYYDDEEGPRFEKTGSAIAPKVAVCNADGSLVDASKYTLSYSKLDGYDDGEPVYEDVNASEVVETGSYRVTATAKKDSGYTGSCSGNFSIVDSNPGQGAKSLDGGDLWLGKSEYAVTGSPVVPTFYVQDSRGDDVDSSVYKISYEKAAGWAYEDEWDDDEAIYTPVAAQDVTGVGRYRVTVTAKDGSGYTGSCSATFRLVSGEEYDEDGNSPIGMDNTSVDTDRRSYLETGKPIAVNVTVYDGDEENTLSPDKYTLSYQKMTGEDDFGDWTYTNITKDQIVEAGWYRVTATAKDGSGYEGSESDTFQIVRPNDLNAGSLDTEGVYSYTGSAITPKVSVSDGADNDISADKYELSYEAYDDDSDDSGWVSVDASDVVDPGRYRVTATAKPGSGCTGSCSDVFTIAKRTDLNVADVSFAGAKDWYDDDEETYYLYTGKPVSITPVLIGCDGQTVDSKNYAVTYAYRKDRTENESVSADNLVKPGEYLVKIRAKDGSGYTGSRSTWVHVIDPKNLQYASLSIGASGKVAFNDFGGNAVPANAYTISIKKFDKDKSEYVTLDGDKVPGEGSYIVNLTAKKGSGYFGEREVRLRITQSEVSDSKAAKAVDDEIAALGTVTLDSKAAVEKARADYDALTDAQKGLVTKLPALEDAEKAIAELQKAQEQKPDPGKSDTGKTGPGEAEPGKSDPGKPDAGKSDAGKGDTGKTEPGKADSGKGDPGKPDAGKSDTGKTDPGKTNPGKSDAGKPDAGKGDSGKTSAGKAKSAKGKASATVNVKKLTAKSLKKALGKSAKTVKSITLGGKVTSVSSGAFKGLPKLTKVTLGGKVKKISKNAFKGSKVKTLVVKTKKLTKKSVRGALKGSKVTTVQVKVGSKKANKKQAKKYRKIFTKKIAGKKVKVK